MTLTRGTPPCTPHMEVPPRGLSLLGRIKVLNTFILSRLWYRTEFQKITKETEINLHKDILDFIWGKKKHQISEAALILHSHQKLTLS